MNNLNSPIPVKEIEIIVNNHLTKKSPGPDSFNGEFFETIIPPQIKFKKVMLKKFYSKLWL